MDICLYDGLTDWEYTDDVVYLNDDQLQIFLDRHNDSVNFSFVLLFWSAR